MTTRSSSPRPDHSVIPPTPATDGFATPPAAAPTPPEARDDGQIRDGDPLHGLTGRGAGGHLHQAGDVLQGTALGGRMDHLSRDSALATADWAPEPDAGAATTPAGPADRPVKPRWAGRVPVTEVRLRGAAVLVFLCGAAHAPRYWAGLSHGALGATLIASALCMLLALALPAWAAQARLVAATAAVGVTAALAAGQVLGGRFGLPDPTRLWAATLAPPWLAGTAATAAALAALVCTTVRPRTSSERSRAGESARSNPGAGGPS